MNSKSARPSPYDKLIDDDIWAFIDATIECYPVDAVDLSISQQRQLYTKMCAVFYHGRPNSIASRDFQIEPAGLNVREYWKTDNKARSDIAVIYYHGGGFVVGDLESHDDVCAEICAASGYRVFACNYRLAPEHIHPAAFEDALALFVWVAERVAQAQNDTIILAGDSAGANLAAAVAAHTRGSKQASAGLVLIYPYLGGPSGKGSEITHAHAPMLTTEELRFYHQIRTGSTPPSPSDYRYAPLWADDFTDLPNSVVFSAECDPLCDEGQYYTDAVIAAGGKSHWFKERGLVHGYLRARHRSRRAGASFERILLAITALGNKQWPY